MKTSGIGSIAKNEPNEQLQPDLRRCRKNSQRLCGLGLGGRDVCATVLLLSVEESQLGCLCALQLSGDADNLRMGGFWTHCRGVARKLVGAVLWECDSHSPPEYTILLGLKIAGMMIHAKVDLPSKSTAIISSL